MNTDLTEREIRAFVGSKARYYLQKWAPVLDGLGKETGFNLAAFCLNVFWLPYRKMYKITFILYGFIVLGTILDQVLFNRSVGNPDLLLTMLKNMMIGLAIALICGALGNRWYLSHVRNAITQLRTQGLPEDAYYEKLSKRGGTNLIAPIGYFILYTILDIVVTVAL